MWSKYALFIDSHINEVISVVSEPVSDRDQEVAEHFVYAHGITSVVRQGSNELVFILEVEVSLSLLPAAH